MSHYFWTTKSIGLGVLLLSIFSTSVSLAGPSLCAIEFGSPPRHASEESAIEVEIDAAPAVVNLFTTLDGTIRPLLEGKGTSELSPELQKELTNYVGPDGDPLSVPWDILSGAEKIQVISASGDLHLWSAWNRSVPGLIYREKVQLKFTVRTRFAGRSYNPGTYTFATRDIFSNTKIEFMSKNRMKVDLGFELHVRSGLSAGENFLTAQNLQLALIGKASSMHGHTVAPEPVTEKQHRAALASGALDDKYIPTLRAMDHIMTAMLYFDFEMMNHGLSMTLNMANDGSGADFFPVQPQAFVSLSQSFANRFDTTSSTKSGTMGIRNKKFYDKENLWGTEARFLSPLLDPTRTQIALDNLQNRMISKSYFLNEAEALAFFNAKIDGKSEPSWWMPNLVYSSDFDKVREAMNLSESDSQFFSDAAAANDFVKMLFHDWSNSPMFTFRPGRLAQIKVAQEYCRKLLLNGQKSTEVMIIFGKKSGIVYDINQAVVGFHPENKPAHP